ncbi:V-set and immunoglobulin domain-containing protein 2 isoform X1 [Globicephala melas]|uniref:V-set and immunoglobulin domain-containing protein 2 isoform X1 n=2 Tax=Globicephala melas TaxID=9731 RepID=UPI00122F967C|nr:V-set and immunoglobulin domain-containing protein 2 isoform X1 [Globicephala melas]
MPPSSSCVTLSLQSTSSDLSPVLKYPPQAQPFPQSLTASEIGGRGTKEGSRARMIPVLRPGGGRSTSLPEGQASPLVCSEIASLAGARHQEAAVWALATFSQSQTPRRTKSRQDAAMAWLQGPFLCGALLGWVCLSAPGLAVEVKVPIEPLSAPVGKTAELTCSYSTSVGDNFALEWSFVQPGRPVSSSQPILYFTNGQLYPTGSKAERASLLQNPPTGGVATLKLTDVHPSDTGTYLCHVNNPPDFYSNGLGLINLTVLVPPNSPSCSQSGQTSVGGSTALRCSSSEGAPRPVYNWIRLGSSPTPPPGSMVQDEVSGRLILTNLSLASSGTYRCVATNQMGSASCELTLSVTEPSKGRVAGAVIGVLLGMLFLSVAVFCLIRFQKDRRKKPKETYGGSDLREDATAPGISEQTSVRADSNSGLLERPSSASTVTTTKSKLPMLV